MKNNNISIEQDILPTDLKTEIEQHFLDYAISVISDRAIPDVRSGLKPVHTRILWAMFENGLTKDKPHKKSADTVGSVLGRYHCHSDASVYDAMIRLGQDFTLRYPLVDVHGNVGSRDGDPPGSMRYTEARLSLAGELMLKDIKENVIEFGPNFSEDRLEPTVLPSKLPQLIVNGSSGIAIAMACNFLPHNLKETVQVVEEYVKNRDISYERILDILQGPDFPTGGIVINKRDLIDIYKNGRGRVVVKSKYHLEKNNVVITEIPYAVKKEKLLLDLIAIIEKENISSITDIRDESTDDVRIVIEFSSKDAIEPTMKHLMVKSSLQAGFSMNQTGLLKDRTPKVFGFKELIEEYVSFQLETITRRILFRKEKALKRKEIVEGLIVALKNIDKIIGIIKNSSTTQEAKGSLIKTLSLTDLQCDAILDMKLSRLTKLEENKLLNELKELNEKLNYYEEILGSAEKLENLFLTELKADCEPLFDDRRTLITDEEIPTAAKAASIKKEVVHQDVMFSINPQGKISFIKRNTKTAVKPNTYYFDLSTNQKIFAISSLGISYPIKVKDIKDKDSIFSLAGISPSEKILQVFSEEDKYKYLILVTKKGFVKKSDFSLYKTGIRPSKAINLTEKDELAAALLVSAESELIIGTSKGGLLRLDHSKILPIGKATKGVIGIKLRPSETCVGAAAIYSKTKNIITLLSNGKENSIPLSQITLKNRGTQSILFKKEDSTYLTTIYPENKL